MTGFLTTRSLRPWHSCIHQRKTLSFTPCSMTTAGMKQTYNLYLWHRFEVSQWKQSDTHGCDLDQRSRCGSTDRVSSPLQCYFFCYLYISVLLRNANLGFFYYVLAVEKLGLGITTVAVPLEASRGHSMRAQHAYYKVTLTLFTPFFWEFVVTRCSNLDEGKK